MSVVQLVDDQRVSRWLWQSAQITLIVAILIGIIGISLTATGAFDPFRAGSLQWQITQFTPLEINPSEQQNQILTEKLPEPPFTLEINAMFDAASDPLAQWRLLIQSSQLSSARIEAVGVDGSGNYWHGDTAGRIPFPHLRLPGQPNQLTIDVDSSGIETIRFNQEVAWQGVYPLQHAPGNLILIGIGGWQTNLQLQWMRVAAYAP